MRGPALRHFYDREYHFGEDIDRPNPDRLWRALRELAPLERTTFLDLGCGVGWATALAAERGSVGHAVGLDFSQTALGLAARAAHEWASPAQQRVSWVCGDGVSLPFADGTFDRAFSFGAMEHFPDVRVGFAELSRVLRPGGLAVTVVPNFYVRTAQPVEHRDTSDGWRRIIASSGLRVLRVGADRGPAILKNRRPARIALRLGLRLLGTIPPLRYQFIFVLQKP